MTDPLLITVGDVVGPAKKALVTARPSAEPHIEGGRYGDIFAGLAAQAGVARARLVSEVEATRLGSASGQALLELAPEFEFEPLVGRTFSIGEAVLTRPVVHYRAGTAITTADASSEATSSALLTAIAEALTAHFVDVYSSLTGLGAHIEADPSSIPALSFVTMGNFVDIANGLKGYLNDHVLNEDVHRDADEDNFVATADAAASDPLTAYSAQTTPAKLSLHRLANALKVALNAHLAREARAGAVRLGTRLSVTPDATATPPIAGGQYVATADAVIRTGEQSVTVRLRASAEGAATNLPRWPTGEGPTLTLGADDALFDDALEVTELRAAGGSEGQSDPAIRRGCRAAFAGRSAPVVDALVAGALQGGAAHVVNLEDQTSGGSFVYAADESWAQSDAWLASIEQALNDGYRGLGCRLSMGAIRNRIIRMSATVLLKDTRDLSDTSSITEAIRLVLKAYFDDRADWYTWSVGAMKAVIAAADRRILTCSSVAVSDADGVPLGSSSTAVTAGDTLIHWEFSADRPADIAYEGPAS